MTGLSLLSCLLVIEKIFINSVKPAITAGFIVLILMAVANYPL